MRHVHGHGLRNGRCSFRQARRYRSINLPRFSQVSGSHRTFTAGARRISRQHAGSACATAFACLWPCRRSRQPDTDSHQPRSAFLPPRLRIPLKALSLVQGQSSALLRMSIRSRTSGLGREFRFRQDWLQQFTHHARLSSDRICCVCETARVMTRYPQRLVRCESRPALP